MKDNISDGKDGVLKMSSRVSNDTTETFMPIRSIANNMIELDNGEKIAGVKVSPRNIFILEENEEFSIIDGLKDFYNTLDFEFWLIITDRPVDIASYIAQLQVAYNQAQSPVIRKLINQDLSKASDFSDTVTDYEFYFLFKEKNIDLIQKRIRMMINGLANAGLSSSQANNDDLRSIIDSFFNDGQKISFGTVMS